MKTYRHYFVAYILPVAVALLLPHLAEDVAGADTYYVAANGGSDTTLCSVARNNINAPKATISGPQGGLSCLAGGDTLDIRAGTYAERIQTPSAAAARGPRPR